MFFAKRFDLDLRMIKLWAKIGTLRMGQKGDITLDLPYNVLFQHYKQWEGNGGGGNK